MLEPDFKKAIEQARMFLKDVKTSLEKSDRRSIDFSFLVKSFYEFYEDWEIFNYTFHENFSSPDDIEINIKHILYDIRSSVLQDDHILWEEYIREGISVLQDIKSSIDFTFYNTSPEFRSKAIDRIIRYIMEVDSAIKEYDKKFPGNINLSIAGDLNLVIKAIEYKLSLKLAIESKDKNLSSINIDFIDADRILDLYEEIEKLPKNSKERRKKKKILKIWTDIFNRETNKK